MNTQSFELRDQWTARNPDLDTSSMEVVGLIRDISREIEGAIERLSEGGSLKRSELGILLPLRYNSEPMIGRSLADGMKLSPAAVSKTLASLEKRGLITRKPSLTNRRAALIRITAAGQEAIDSVFPQQLELISEVLSGLGSDRLRVIEALHQLLDVIGHGTRLKVPSAE